jgi:hypothetical protein
MVCSLRFCSCFSVAAQDHDDVREHRTGGSLLGRWTHCDTYVASVFGLMHAVRVAHNACHSRQGIKAGTSHGCKRALKRAGTNQVSGACVLTGVPSHVSLAIPL